MQRGAITAQSAAPGVLAGAAAAAAAAGGALHGSCHQRRVQCDDYLARYSTYGTERSPNDPADWQRIRRMHDVQGGQLHVVRQQQAVVSATAAGKEIRPCSTVHRSVHSPPSTVHRQTLLSAETLLSIRTRGIADCASGLRRPCIKGLGCCACFSHHARPRPR